MIGKAEMWNPEVTEQVKYNQSRQEKYILFCGT